jgi:DNA-binding HxlR family transcriptional regulator
LLQYINKGEQQKQKQQEQSASNYERAIIPQASFIECPIKASLKVLGKKWTILIIRDIGVYKVARFNRLLESVSGITARVLSMRLKELEKEGFIECIEKRDHR